MSYYPAFLDMKDKPCVVVGGGKVALRKVKMLVDHEARVLIISPGLCFELETLIEDKAATVTRREYQAGDLEGAFLVIAATDEPDTNENVAREAVAKGILVNVVDVPALSNFIVPSYLRRGDLTVAVSTGGKSPALSRRMRRNLEDHFGEEYGRLVSLVAEVRSELRGTVIKDEVWQEALEIESLLDLIRSGKRDEAKARLKGALLGAGR